MQKVMSATAVRADFSQFIDSVVRDKPQAVKRNRDVFLSLSLQHLSDILTNYEFAFEYEQGENGSFVGSLLPFEDIIASGDSLDELIENFAEQLIEYAEDYYQNFSRYYNSPNRREHLPYVLNILIQDNLDGVKKLIRG